MTEDKEIGLLFSPNTRVSTIRQVQKELEDVIWFDEMSGELDDEGLYVEGLYQPSDEQKIRDYCNRHEYISIQNERLQSEQAEVKEIVDRWTSQSQHFIENFVKIAMDCHKYDGQNQDTEGPEREDVKDD